MMVMEKQKMKFVRCARLKGKQSLPTVLGEFLRQAELADSRFSYEKLLHIPKLRLCHIEIPCSLMPSMCFFAPYPLLESIP